jgi:hypothetical protein
MSKQLDLVISILKESATAHKIGDTVWAKDSVKRYITHAGKIVDISPGKITIKKLSGALTTHNTEDVSKDYEHLNPNPYRKNESEEIEESFTVKDASGKVVHVALTQSAAEKKAAELQASTKEKHTAGYSRESVVKEEWNAAYAEGKRHGSQGTGNNGQKAKKDWGDDFHHYNRGFLEGRNAKAKSLKAVGQGYGKKTNEAEDLEELNKSTIDSYKEKATDELKQAKKYSKSEYGDIAKRIMARRTSGLSRVLKRNESEEDLDESANPLTQNLPGKSTHITKKDIRHSDGGIVLGSTALRNVEGDKYEIRSGRYRGKVATFHPDNLQKIDEECVSEGIIKKKKPHPDHAYHEKTNVELKQVMNLGDAEKGKVASAILNYRGNWDKAPVRVKEDLDESVVAWKKETMKKHGDVEFVKKASTGGLNNRTTIARKSGGDILAVYHHAKNYGTVYEPKNESSLEDLHTGKGDGKELKASPEYRRDRRRTAQMLAAQKEVQARVKRGYAEDDKDLDESAKGHTMEAHGVKGMKNTPWRKTFKSSDHAVDWAEKNDAEIHGTRDLEQAKKGNLSPVVKEDLDEAKLVSPLKGHVYHTKSDAELRYIVKDAGEAAKAQKGMSSEGKYLDQMNDASTVLHYRSKGGKQITATNPRMVAPKSTDDSIKAKLAKWKKNESEEVDEGILSKLAGKIMGAAPKEPKYKVGQVVSYETPEDQPDWKDRGRGKGTITKYSNGHYIVNGNPVNHFDIKKVHESVDPDESSKGHTMEAHGVKGSIEEVSTARLKSYAEKAREDAEKLTKQGDAAKTDKTKLAKYVKATKRRLNAHKADDKISSNEFYGKK